MEPPKLKNEPQNADIKKSKFTSREPSENICYDFAAKLLDNLNMLRQKKRCCDVEIKLGKERFSAHRAILSVSSPYFHAMFTGELCEKDKKCVELHGLHSNTFQTILDFMYSGVVTVNEENVEDLIIAADMFGIVEIVTECTHFLVDQLDESNAIGIYLFARDHNILELKVSAVRFIEENFPNLAKEAEIYELDRETFINFLGSEYLKISSECEVFQAAMKWINHDIAIRKQYVFDVLKEVRLPLISFTFLEKAIDECPDASLKVALKSVHSDMVNQKGVLAPLNCKRRKCAKKDIYVIGGSKKELNNIWDRRLVEIDYASIAKFDTFTREWTKAPDMRLNRALPGVVSLNGHIYVVGVEGHHNFPSCERYDPVTKTWTEIANLPSPRFAFGLCELDGYLYAIGGCANTVRSHLIERYNPSTDSWELVGYMPKPRFFNMGLVSYEGLIYMVGGCSGNGTEQDLMSYNPVTGKWQKLASMSIARFDMGVAVLDDYLYVVGGMDSSETLSSVEKYSFKQNKWELIPNMRLERSGPAVCATDGLLYVIGGELQSGVTSAVECFDPHKNTWSDCPPLSEARTASRAVAI